MQTKKIRDILPPRHVVKEVPAEKEKKSGSPRRQHRPPGFKRVFFTTSFLILLAGVSGVLALHFIFARAEVSIWPNTREVSVEERISASLEGGAQDLAATMIPALTIEEGKEITRLFAATGKAQEAKKAQGTIRVFNGFSTFPQKLVANTRFLSQEGKLFRSQAVVVVPAGHMEAGKLVAGFLDIEVQAAEAGEEYNIGSSHFSLPGLFGNPAYTLIYGESSLPMAGGLKEEITVVTESDLTLARDALVEELRQDVRESLQARVAGDMVLLQEAITLEVEEASSPIKPGARLDSFNFSAKVEGFGITFSKTDIDKAIQAKIAQGIKEAEKLAKDTILISYEHVEMNTSSQVLSFDAKALALVYQEVDPEEIKAHLAGTKREDAATILSKNSALDKAEILFFPPWRTSFPKDPGNVHVKLVID